MRILIERIIIPKNHKIVGGIMSETPSKIQSELTDPPWNIKIKSPEDDNSENVVNESMSGEKIPSSDSVIDTNNGDISEEYNLNPEMGFAQKGTAETDMDNNDNSLDRDERRKMESEKSRDDLLESMGGVPAPRNSPVNVTR